VHCVPYRSVGSSSPTLVAAAFYITHPAVIGENCVDAIRPGNGSGLGSALFSQPLSTEPALNCIVCDFATSRSMLLWDLRNLFLRPCCLVAWLRGCVCVKLPAWSGTYSRWTDDSVRGSGGKNDKDQMGKR